MAKKARLLEPATGLLLLATLFAASSVTCMPNIRIQVNNDNLQSPPYLLEAIKQAESQAAAAEMSSMSGQSSSNKEMIAAHSPQQLPLVGAEASKETLSADAPASTLTLSSGDEAADSPGGFSVVKEETVEEILDLDPEGAMKALQAEASSSLSTAVLAPQDESLTKDSMSPPSVPEQATVDQQESTHSSRKSQTLEVTSSHLKKPAKNLDNQDTNLSSRETELSDKAPEFPSGGAKSLISPSVANEEPPAPSNAELLKRKVQPVPPDTWSPHQVMGELPDGTSVPAIVNREYGHQTRTKITLGGGYVRNRQPTHIVKSETTSDNEPSAARDKQKQLGGQTSTDQVTRIVEIPERIVLTEQTSSKPISAQRPVVETFVISANKTKPRPAGKPDSRCTKQGLSTMEHPTACDKYYVCEDGYLSEHVCPNGLMYGLRDIVLDYCVHRWSASCEDKSMPNPISSPGCRWQYGIFNVQGSPKCTPDYYECTAGVFEVKKCSIDGQVYDDRSKSCRFAEQVGCLNEALSDFHCPPDDQGNTYWPFPRYFLNERALIHCINDKPEIVRCTEHERVDPEHLHCVLTSKLRDDSALLADRRLPAQKRKSKQE